MAETSGTAASDKALAVEQPPATFSRIETDSSALSQSSGLPSEVESDSEAQQPSSELRKLRRELEREKHRNSQLQAQLKRQTQLQGRLVRPADAAPFFCPCRQRTACLRPVSARLRRACAGVRVPCLTRLGGRALRVLSCGSNSKRSRRRSTSPTS